MQATKDQPDPFLVLGLDAGLCTVQEVPLQPTMAKASNHGSTVTRYVPGDKRILSAGITLTLTARKPPPGLAWAARSTGAPDAVESLVLRFTLQLWLQFLSITRPGTAKRVGLRRNVECRDVTPRRPESRWPGAEQTPGRIRRAWMPAVSRYALTSLRLGPRTSGLKPD